MENSIVLAPVGYVASPIHEAIDDVWGGVRAQIHLDESRFSEDCLEGLIEFSHIEVLFQFHLVPVDGVERGARHPRGRVEWPRAGIFAQRAKARPNRLGVSICRLHSVRGLTLEVEGLDAVDGTPVVDIKPYMEEFGPKGLVRQPDWSRELMVGYWNSAR
ncbi:MAG: SAM-dependent methyltransferase [Bryobacterales bacterium]|nr:SAM-dependent methyltransferase [Bryobacterales bacterium]